MLLSIQIAIEYSGMRYIFELSTREIQDDKYCQMHILFFLFSYLDVTVAFWFVIFKEEIICTKTFYLKSSMFSYIYSLFEE